VNRGQGLLAEEMHDKSWENSEKRKKEAVGPLNY
jgi:hypothetical protein